MITHLVDATLFFSRTSGGVRRYLLAKHDWLERQPLVRHTLVVPGAADRGTAGAIVPFANPPLRARHRCPLRLAAFRRTFASLGPDLIEVGDPYLVGWQVARVAEELRIPVVAFCHSDVIGLASHRLGSGGGRLAARYVRALYRRYAQILAPSEVVATRLREAGILHVAVQPLGVDHVRFAPARRDHRLRERLGLGPTSRLLVFAGRLAPEKNLPELFRMIELLGAPYDLLIIGGERFERPTARVTILPYDADPARSPPGSPPRMHSCTPAARRRSASSRSRRWPAACR